ncbi:glycosyltransferase [Dellaglioa algida]|uniref:glycosyltransferase n=1 Tax=Dellaglioa algida TaxID=105612 RepID=UPI0024C49DAA|nr:glycosyltransferase [Dellaglioa algida]MDK1724761.1 glycosyltransferase [Dellaglioa algida]MDK1738699.1 glycosyltransferase [Dellaglioa algida]
MNHKELKIINVIVIYNLLITDSPIFNCLTKQLNKDAQILIVDNSTNEIISKQNGLSANTEKYVKYLSSGGNFGLSKAYNRVQQFRSQFDWAVFWDQDTKCSSDYLEHLRVEILNNKTAKMIVPIVYSAKGQMSPRSYEGSRIKGPIEGYGFKKRLTAINSGLAVEIEKFVEIGMYNEKMFIDYLDHDLIIRYNRLVGDIFVSQNILKQNFSDDHRDNYQGDIFRFSKYITDYKIFTNNVSGSEIFYWSKIFYRAVKLGMSYKSFSFIKEVFKTIKFIREN